MRWINTNKIFRIFATPPFQIIYNLSESLYKLYKIKSKGLNPEKYSEPWITSKKPDLKIPAILTCKINIPIMPGYSFNPAAIIDKAHE